MINLNFIWIDFECPNCNYEDQIQFVDAKSEKVIFCNNCKCRIQLTDSESSVHSSIDKINKTMNDLNKLFKNFGK